MNDPTNEPGIRNKRWRLIGVFLEDTGPRSDSEWNERKEILKSVPLRMDPCLRPFLEFYLEEFRGPPFAPYLCDPIFDRSSVSGGIPRSVSFPGLEGETWGVDVYSWVRPLWVSSTYSIITDSWKSTVTLLTNSKLVRKLLSKFKWIIRHLTSVSLPSHISTFFFYSYDVKERDFLNWDQISTRVFVLESNPLLPTSLVLSRRVSTP